MLSYRRGYLWLAAGLVLAVTAGLTAFFALQRAATVPQTAPEPARVQVLVATRDIPLHTVIAAGDLALRDVPPELVPQGGLKDAQTAIGKLTMSNVTRGEIILDQRLIAPDYVGPNAAFTIDAQEVIVALPATDLLGSLDIVRPGDRVDIMFSLDLGRAHSSAATGLNTLTVLQNVRVADVVRSQGPAAQQTAKPAVQALLIAVDPQDALTLKSFRDAGGTADLALRGPTASGVFEVTPIDGAYLFDRYRIGLRPTP